jgi:hypothetical protein
MKMDRWQSASLHQQLGIVISDERTVPTCMPNLIGLRAAASRFSIESWLFALPMTAPANHYSIAFGHFLTIHASEKSLSPKGGTAGDG